MGELIGLILLGLVIYYFFGLKKKENNKIMESPQYQIYLKALVALKQAGYEISECNFRSAHVKRGYENYGMVFFAKEPGRFISILSYFSSTIRGWTNYASWLRVIEMVENGKERGKSYWPDNSLVGGFTQDSKPYTYNEEWLDILASVISE